MDSSSISKPSVELESIDSLKSNPRNARTHSKHQIRQIAESIRSFGFTNPVLVDVNRTIIAGHGRVEGAKLLGLKQVPTIRLEGLTADQIRAYVLADNKLAENAGWDRSILAVELQNLLTMDEIFDVTITGFEVPEIDAILSAANQEPDPSDSFELDETATPVSAADDLWLLGKHRVFCGNAIQEKSYGELMARKQATLIITDPPFNVPIDGNVCGKGAIHHREFAMAAGEMSGPEFVSFLASCLRLLARHSTKGSVHFIFMDWRHMSELLAAGGEVYDQLLNLCVWVKDNGGMGSFYRSRHELVFVFRNGKGRHRNNVKLGQFGRNRTNVWEYPGVNTFSKQGEEGNLLAVHPTVKPIALVADALLDCSARGEIVLDCFLGSGTTLMAAERVGRICYGMEIDPIYVDVAIRRWQRYTGDRAVHAKSGKSFDEIANATEACNG